MRSIYDGFAAPTAGCVLTWYVIEQSENMGTTWFDFTPTGQSGKWYKKYALHLIFTIYLNRYTAVLELLPVAVFRKNLNEVRVDP